MSSTAFTSLQIRYTLGLLKGCKSLSDMAEQGFLPVSRQYACRLLAYELEPHRHALARRSSSAPRDGFLAIDLLTVKHEGQQIEGIGRQHDSSRKAISWGHTFVSSALVVPDKDPFVLRCDPYLSQRMATRAYPKLTPSEALLNVVGDAMVEGYERAGVLADAQFCSRLSMRSLKAMGVPFVMRFRKNAKVLFEAQLVQAKDLAERFSPGKARWYPKLKRYIKRIEVVIEEVGIVDLFIIWKAQGFGWHLSILISTLAGGVQDIARAWNARWSLEVSHRFRKQSLALGACQCLAFAAHLQHADLVNDAFNLVREARCESAGLSWKAARANAAATLEDALLTGTTRVAA